MRLIFIGCHNPWKYLNTEFLHTEKSDTKKFDTEKLHTEKSDTKISQIMVYAFYCEWQLKPNAATLVFAINLLTARFTDSDDSHISVASWEISSLSVCLSLSLPLFLSFFLAALHLTSNQLK